MQKITVSLEKNSYEIYLQEGLLARVSELLPEKYCQGKLAIITDSNVAPLYLERLVKQFSGEPGKVIQIVIPAGETSKRLEVAGEIYEQLAKTKFSRSDLIIALGGGVVGDLAGFVAATYMRGVKFLQIPTSLLAQVDSSIGGKVAVDIPSGKNLVGTFYQPLAVYIDPELLQTLSDRFFFDGLAEVIKYACIKDLKLFEKLQVCTDRINIQKEISGIIVQCLQIKRYYVQLDEFDTGERMFLNFGHTIGHALEKCFNFEKYTHGEAVAIGMLLITQSSEALGLTALGTTLKLRKLLEQYHLPITYQQSLDNKDEFTQQLLAAIAVDKKNFQQQLNLVLLKEIGQSFLYKVKTVEMEKFLK